jgi:hypothetical protein
LPADGTNAANELNGASVCPDFAGKEKLPAVIDTLIAAVRAGELDEHLNQAANTRTIDKVKKAA